MKRREPTFSQLFLVFLSLSHRIILAYVLCLNHLSYTSAFLYCLFALDARETYDFNLDLFSHFAMNLSIVFALYSVVLHSNFFSPSFLSVPFGYTCIFLFSTFRMQRTEAKMPLLQLLPSAHP